jgi:hypothetical protein
LSEALETLNGLAWLLGTLVPLLFAQRWLHREIQALLLILTRRPALVIGIFSFLFFPGILLHETSHLLMARLLGVRTGRFSLLPKLLGDGRLRMGFVETESTDFFRDALIGAAPLITGGAVVAYMGIFRLGLGPLADAIRLGTWVNLVEILRELPGQPDFWLWFYLAFTISSTMFPSSSDRRGWLPVVLLLVVLTSIAVLAGAGPWLVDNLAPGVNAALLSVAAVFGISLVPHIALGIPIGLLRRLFSRITGYSPV